MITNIQNNSIQFRHNQQNINHKKQHFKSATPKDDLDNEFLLQAMESQRLAAKEKQKENWNKAGIIAQGATAAGFVTIAIVAVLGLLGFKNHKGGKNAVDNELKALTGINLNWIDFANSKKVAPLDSKTTAKSLNEAFNNIINNRSLSTKAKEWSGDSTNLDIMYLYGHGGTGKTYVAKQFAQETGSMFTCIKYPDLGSPYKDAASIRISNCFDEIIKKAEAFKDRKIVVCIDEIDAVMRKVPEGQHGAEEVAKSRAAVLTGLDKLRDKCTNVTVIATSNYHPKNGIVDPIALRRFNNKIEVPLPKKEQIQALLEMYLQDIGAIKDSKFLNSSELSSFAKKLEQGGYSNGEIELIAKESGKIFGNTLKDVSDTDLKNHKFKVKYLEDAMKLNGDAASKTNKLMNVTKSSSKSEGKSLEDLNWLQKIMLLFFNK